ncbi:hypothetical protein GSI_09807 [Ganoderma sinense ZZ0214-1]|uniref:Uncharacterized protein n=1 Tax=Ganoderma sinense ZZ0214-1 TaxID=1077348 RepID=A0A2G8S2Q7_9APHY|nr:hypothetical protein GSI_09807 [Ganoderma sinense ZZ0214-1]
MTSGRELRSTWTTWIASRGPISLQVPSSTSLQSPTWRRNQRHPLTQYTLVCASGELRTRKSPCLNLYTGPRVLHLAVGLRLPLSHTVALHIVGGLRPRKAAFAFAGAANALVRAFPVLAISAPVRRHRCLSQNDGMHWQEAGASESWSQARSPSLSVRTSLRAVICNCRAAAGESG